MKRKSIYEMSGVSFESTKSDRLSPKLSREDYLIENDIKKILINDINFSSSKISFKVMDGIISLFGEVSSFKIRMDLHNDLLKIDGIVEIKDHLSVCSDL